MFTGKIMASWVRKHGVELVFSRPGKQTDNPFIESLNGRVRYEFPNKHEFLTLEEMRDGGDGWRYHYNGVRRQSSLEDKTPEAFDEELRLRGSISTETGPPATSAAVESPMVSGGSPTSEAGQGAEKPSPVRPVPGSTSTRTTRKPKITEVGPSPMVTKSPGKRKTPRTASKPKIAGASTPRKVEEAHGKSVTAGGEPKSKASRSAKRSKETPPPAKLKNTEAGTEPSSEATAKKETTGTALRPKASVAASKPTPAGAIRKKIAGRPARRGRPRGPEPAGGRGPVAASQTHQVGGSSRLHENRHNYQIN